MLTAAERALNAARNAWGAHWQPTLHARAPGRLELLGNHIDYNGGPVLAAAIDRDVVCLAAPAEKPGVAVLLSDISPLPQFLATESLRGWRNSGVTVAPLDYLRGVIATGIERDGGVRDRIQIAVAGDVPAGFGLSSSAALCVALTLALHYGRLSDRELVLRAQEAEHRAGVPCGTMDQSASVGGHVILYDGSSVTWELVTPDLGDYVFAVADSGVARSLGASSYPKRVEESREALARVNRSLVAERSSLAEVTADEVERLRGELPPTLWRRIRHVVSETDRVKRGVAAMRSGDWITFGRLMSESGASSATDYEISHPRVERIVEIARSVSGVAGARMMGGGEGGAALMLVQRNAIAPLIERLDRDYYRERAVDNPEPVRVFRFASGASLTAA